MELWEPIRLEYDLTVTFFPGIPDGETIECRDCEYTMGRLPNGDNAIKQITYFAGCNATSVGRAIRELRDPDNPCNQRIQEYLDVSTQSAGD